MKKNLNINLKMIFGLLKFLNHTLSDPFLCKTALLFSFLFIFFLVNWAVCSEIVVSLSTISAIESSNNPKAIGDGGNALGLHQLHFCVIQDYNRKHKTSYTHQDAFIPSVSTQVASWYLHSEIPRLLRHFKQKPSLENILTAYNQGIGAVIKGKTAKSYINKYRRLHEKQLLGHGGNAKRD